MLFVAGGKLARGASLITLKKVTEQRAAKTGNPTKRKQVKETRNATKHCSLPKADERSEINLVEPFPFQPDGISTCLAFLSWQKYQVLPGKQVSQLHFQPTVNNKNNFFQTGNPFYLQGELSKHCVSIIRSQTHAET